MKTIEIYKNYGCTTAEKRTLYSYPMEYEDAVSSEKMTVVIPDGWDIFENTFGEEMIESPWGGRYTIASLLVGNDKPMFMAIRDTGEKVFAELEEAKYFVLVEDGGSTTGSDMFDNKNAANDHAKMIWDHLTDSEKKNTRVHVAIVRKSDLDDPDDWESFSQYNEEAGLFDSKTEA